MRGSIEVMTEFMSSVMALDDLHGAPQEPTANRRSRTHAVDRAFAAPLPLKPRRGPELAMWTDNIGALVAETFLQALRPTSAGAASSAALDLDMQALMMLRRHSAHFSGLEFVPEPARLFNVVFGPRFAERSPGGVASATAGVCKAMVMARIPLTDSLTGRRRQPCDMGPQSLALAARFVLEALVWQSGRPEEVNGFPPPDVEVAEALAFFNAIEELGGFGEANGLASDLVERLRGASENENFLRALDVFWAAREMTHVIEESVGSLGVSARTLSASGSSASEASASPPPPAPRVPRLQL